MAEESLAPAFALEPIWDNEGNAKFTLVDDAEGLFDPEGIWKTDPLLHGWIQPILVAREPRKTADVYFCPGGMWFFSKRARQSISWTEQGSAEFLPVTIGGFGTYFLLHPLVSVRLAPSAIVRRNEVSRNITDIKRAAFRQDDMGDAAVFYAAQPRDSAAGRGGYCYSITYVNDKAASDLRAAAITGVGLTPTSIA